MRIAGRYIAQCRHLHLIYRSRRDATTAVLRKHPNVSVDTFWCCFGYAASYKIPERRC